MQNSTLYSGVKAGRQIGSCAAKL